MIFAGGEFYYDRSWLSDKVFPFPQSSEFSYFLNGGQACLRVIGNYLVDQKKSKILLPAYLCPSITRTFEQCGIDIDYYQINPDFSIDLDDLVEKVTDPNQAIYFINYFGFPPSAQAKGLLRKWQSQGRIIIEDNAQGGFTETPIGDFVFNSMRKLVPYDGAYLSAPSPMETYINVYRGRMNHRLSLIRRYRAGLSSYLFKNEGNAQELDSLYEQAERFYETDQVVLGDEDEQSGIEHLDWQEIRRVRRENYTYILNQLKGVPGISPVFRELQEKNMPIGLPVYITKVSRNKVNNYLGDQQIGLTVHWENMHENPVTPAQKRAMEISDHILTLTVDQYTNHTQLDYLVENLKEAINQ